MGNTISAKQLEGALTRAQGVGLVEDKFELGDCEIEIRNLLPQEYQDVIKETSELSDLDYLNKWQEGHVCRAIIGLNGVSFRDVSFIECEEPDPKKPDHIKKIKRELHEYLRREVLSTWGKEALYTAYRKFTDLLMKAEEESKKGITFLTPDETAEDKYRRLLGELKDLEGEVPPALLLQILEEHGYTRYDDKAPLGRLDELATPPAQESTEEPPPAAPSPQPVPVAQTLPQDAIRRRVPLNQQSAQELPVVLPKPPPSAPVAAPPVVIPDGPDPVPVMPPALIGQGRRSAEFLAQEMQFDPNILSEATQELPGRPPREEIATLEARQPASNVQALERPPTLGLNPKFRPPGR